MKKYTVFLKTGDKFDFNAEEFTIKYSTVSGSVAWYSLKGAKGPYPLFLDVNQIAAVIEAG